MKSPFMPKGNYIPQDIVDVKHTKAPQAALDRLGYPGKRGAGTSSMVKLRGEKTWRRVMSSEHGVLWVVMNGKKRYLGSSMIPDSRTQAAKWNRSSRHMDSRRRYLNYLWENDPNHSSGKIYASDLSYAEARRARRISKLKRTR